LQAVTCNDDKTNEMKKIFISLLTAIILLPFACNPKEEIAPENPCGKYVRPNAKICFDPLFNATPFNDTLTVCTQLQFRSEFTDTIIYKHTWYVGREKLDNYKFWRDFSEEPRPKTYTVYHTMRWKPNKLCDPLDDGFDSTSFTFTITNKYKEMNVLNKFRMVYDSLNKDSFDIEFYFSQPNRPDSVIKNPMEGTSGGPYDGDKGLAEYIHLKVNGIVINGFNLNRTKIYGQIISTNHLTYFDESQLSIGIGYFSLNPNTKRCKMEFGFSRNKYNLKGRKLY
jgi:hypothetical protein